MAIGTPRIEPTIGRTIGPTHVGTPVYAPSRKLTTSRRRPLAVTLFAVAYLVGGLTTVALILGGFADYGMPGAEGSLGAGWPHAVLLRSAISALAGIFLLLGGSLGWYLAMLLLVDGLLSAGWSCQALVLAEVPPTFWVDHSISVYVKVASRALITLAVMGYLCSATIRDHCSITRSSAVLAIVLLCALEVALVLLGAQAA